MDGFNINKIILSLYNSELFLRKLKPSEQAKVQSFAPEINASLNGTKPQPDKILQNVNEINNITQTLQMNILNNTDRSVFIKNILGLPQNLSEVLLNLQNAKLPINSAINGMQNLNQDIMKNQNVLASIFNEEASEIAEVEKFVQNTQVQNVQAQNAQVQKEAVALIFSGMIRMADVSKLILQNGKEAVASLIVAMAAASKNGLKSEQIQETLSIVNSCIALADSDNPAQSLKSLMMLYLPWLPLNEGVGFDLEISPQEGETESNDSKLTVLIQTKNYGNLKGEFILTTSNSVDVLITCSDRFPKNLLQKSLTEEGVTHSMNTNIDIEEVAPKTDELNEIHETKVNLSATNEMNPYLLLMAHSFIRNTILIDNNASLNAA